jgi:hypothetical protein
MNTALRDLLRSHGYSHNEIDRMIECYPHIWFNALSQSSLYDAFIEYCAGEAYCLNQ